MSTIENDFRLINKGKEWLNLVGTLTKKTWKKFGSISKYLDDIYGKDNWKFIFVANNGEISREKLISHLTKSFEIYFESQDNNIIDWIEKVKGNHNADVLTKKERKIDKDLIFEFKVDLLSDSFNEFLKTKNLSFEDIHFIEIREFFTINREICYNIPFHDKSIIKKHSKRQIWDDNSIQSFIYNNGVIQVYASVLEEEKPAIAIFIRNDLKMGKGKIGAQFSHVAVSLIFRSHFKSKYHEAWISSKNRKIILYKISGLKKLLDIEKMCRDTNTNNSLISDAGHTQLEPGTTTCISVGPLPPIWLSILANMVEATMINF